MSGGEQDGVDPEETVIEESGDAEDDFHPFDEFHEDYKPTRLQKVLGEDGLPTQNAEVIDSDIPPLSPETLICMGDLSEFVVRSKSHHGVIAYRFTPDEVEQAPDGEYLVKEGVTKPVPEIFANSRDQVLMAGSVAEPIRPPCKHYVRQLGQGGDNPNMRVVYRLCAARRTTEGAFMTVGNTGVWACTMREPRHLDSEHRYLNLFDEKKIQQGATRVSNSIFSNKG